MTNLADGAATAVSFTPAAGCAVYPEGNVDAAGNAFTGSNPASQVSGTIDAHTHVTAFEFLGGDFHCGRPWDHVRDRVRAAQLREGRAGQQRTGRELPRLRPTGPSP